MNLRITLFAALVTAMSVSMPQPATAEEFKSPKQCVPGVRVADRLGNTGTIVGMDPGDSVGCRVKIDGSSERRYYIFWMLHPAGQSAETNDRLVAGKYECIAQGRYSFGWLYITGPHSYSMAGTRGTFTVLPSRRIVFRGGVLAKYYGKLLPGPTVGLNGTGDNFYNTTCELRK